MNKFNTIEELLTYTKKIIGKTFSDYDTYGKLNGSTRDKGILGKIIETGFYGYPNNNDAKADFDNIGVELKVAGYKKNKDGSISSKERISLSKINYNEIINEDYQYSKLLFKNKKLLIIWYEFLYDKKYSEFVIKDFNLYDMEKDEKIIKYDYYTIQRKVIDGKAHLLSEGDTSFLGACTKGSSSKDRTKQPNSNILAKPRAFSLKQSYLTGLLRNKNTKTFELDYTTVENYVYNHIKKYIGETQLDIIYDLTNKRYPNGKAPKNINKMISDRLVGKDKDLTLKHNLFAKTNYIIKNLPVDKNGFPLERMSFRNIVLSEFIQDWDNSDWKSFFEEVSIIVICYEADSKNIKNGHRILKEIKKISFTYDDINLFETSYLMVQNCIKKHKISLLPYPKSYKNQILEIAPKGNKGDDAYNTFFNKDTTHTSFMLDKDFLYTKLKD